MSKKRKPNAHQLIAAVNRRDLKFLQKYLADGGDVNAILDFAGGSITLLSYIAGCQFIEGVRALLALGADPNRTATSGPTHENSGPTALQEVINGDDTHIVDQDDERRYKIVDTLLRAGADLDAVPGVKSLYGAACRGFVKICERLIEAGASVKEVPAGCIKCALILPAEGAVDGIGPIVPAGTNLSFGPFPDTRVSGYFPVVLSARKRAINPQINQGDGAGGSTTGRLPYRDLIGLVYMKSSYFPVNLRILALVHTFKTHTNKMCAAWPFEWLPIVVRLYPPATSSRLCAFA